MKDKIQGKMDRHYPITVNGQKCRILSYKTDGTHLTLIAKIRSDELFCPRPGVDQEIVIETPPNWQVFTVQWESASSESGVFRTHYRILAERKEPIPIVPDFAPDGSPEP